MRAATELKLILGAEAFNLLNHPNFSVASNTQSPLTPGGNEDAVFKDPAGDPANNVWKDSLSCRHGASVSDVESRGKILLPLPGTW